MTGLWHVHPKKHEGEGFVVWLRNHSLQIFLIGLTLLQTAAAGGLLYLTWRWGWDQFKAGKTPPWPAFATFFAAQYLISIVADTYGAWLQVWATAKFHDPDSPEAN